MWQQRIQTRFHILLIFCNCSNTESLQLFFRHYKLNRILLLQKTFFQGIKAPMGDQQRARSDNTKVIHQFNLNRFPLFHLFISKVKLPPAKMHQIALNVPQASIHRPLEQVAQCTKISITDTNLYSELQIVNTGGYCAQPGFLQIAFAYVSPTYTPNKITTGKRYQGRQSFFPLNRILISAFCTPPSLQESSEYCIKKEPSEHHPKTPTSKILVFFKMKQEAIHIVLSVLK